MHRLEIDSVRQTQAALEAIEVLKEAGFFVGDFSIETEPRESVFSLEVDLEIGENERPLEA